eukprot:TRINITY_DN9289_c0_g1_i1.p2 TRINITY_DN9289_c0_g1~~TRINITY_DN9289_c0_g1_i1.p2  ORF type:complete len:68 (+),score=13.23 TRINITY_DN9289_c0_g1_i1:39-242(+)
MQSLQQKTVRHCEQKLDSGFPTVPGDAVEQLDIVEWCANSTSLPFGCRCRTLPFKYPESCNNSKTKK